MKRIFDENHANVATSYNKLASVYEILGEYNQAKELSKKALMITKKIFGENHDCVATSYNNLASVYECLGESIKPKNFSKKH